MIGRLPYFLLSNSTPLRCESADLTGHVLPQERMEAMPTQRRLVRALIWGKAGNRCLLPVLLTELWVTGIRMLHNCTRKRRSNCSEMLFRVKRVRQKAVWGWTSAESRCRGNTWACPKSNSHQTKRENPKSKGIQNQGKTKEQEGGRERSTRQRREESTLGI